MFHMKHIQKIRRKSLIVRSAADLPSPARFERAAFRLGGERSILLSYGDRCKNTPNSFFIMAQPRPVVKAGRFIFRDSFGRSAPHRPLAFFKTIRCEK